MKLAKARYDIAGISRELATVSNALPSVGIETGLEVAGWDVWLHGQAAPPVGGVAEIDVWAELKPSLGDDIPAVLR